MAGPRDVFGLTVLIYRDEDCPGQFVAHCLEFDIVAVGSTRPRALVLLKELIEEAVLAAYDDGTEDELFNPAPRQYWRKLAHSRPYRPTRDVTPFVPSILPVKEVNYAAAQ